MINVSEKLSNLKRMQDEMTKLGGIGAAHVGSPTWKEKKIKKQKMVSYGN
jgi:hypothetical protein